MPSPSPRYLNTRQVADLTGISESQLNKFRVYGGGAPYVKVGARVLYREDDVTAWLDAKRRNSTSDPGHPASAA